MPAKTKDEPCINPNCKNKQYCRGLCRSCYQMSANLIADGVVTDEQLVEAGKRLPYKYSTTDWLLDGVKS